MSKLNNIPLAKFERKATAFTTTKLEAAKEEMLAQYAEDKVTASLFLEENGGDAGLMGGKGSLYGFLGFIKGQENPAEELGLYLDRAIKITKKEKVPGKAQIKYSRAIPSNKDIRENITPLEWTSVGWPELIERGVSGLEHFLYLGGKKSWDKSIENKSRSGAGLQASNALRDNSFEPTPELSKSLEDFIKDLKSQFVKKI